MNEIRRQWVLAFKENGITTLEQVEAGMRMVRRRAPIPAFAGQFINWCREGRSVLGITVADVMAEYWKWRKLVFRYPSSEQYPRRSRFITISASSCGTEESIAR